jgi:hypothetical protein
MDKSGKRRQQEQRHSKQDVIWTPIMEKMVQTAKQMVKANVENHRARLWSPLRKLSKVPIALGLQ